MHIDRLETPALVLDAKILSENIEAMKKILEGSSLKLRPHYKSHKCSFLAKNQIKDGAKGMTCAKLSEAIDLADSGVEDILIANQITDDKKIRRLADLAGDCHLTVCVDNIYNVEKLAEAAKNAGNIIYCYIEFEIGMERCGVKTKEEVLLLAKTISEKSHLRYGGIQAYAGHISHEVSEGERKKLTDENSEKIKELISFLEENGIATENISGGSTGTAMIKAKDSLYTELQAGSYLFMDATYKDLNLPFKNSLFVLTTVVSKNDNLTVVDAGVKTCGVDQGMPEIVCNKAEKIVASEEHFQLHGLSDEVSVGDKMLLIPGHCCSTVNLHDKIYLVKDGKVIDRIIITGKGVGR